MFNILPLKKALRIVLRKCVLKKRIRTSNALVESMKDDKEKNNHSGTILIILLLLAIFEIRFIIVASTNIKEFVYIRMSSQDRNWTTYYTNANEAKREEITLPICYVNITGLGEISINKTITEYSSRVKYPNVTTGGYYRPRDCRSRHKIAILVPYRNRKRNLDVFLYYIHSFLMRQKLEYRIFVIEQNGTDYFNRGKLFNAGFLEMKKFGEWDCVIFHDVDLLPLDNRILYTCPFWPLHMCATVVEVKNPNFRSLFGGVSSMLVQQFHDVNGYSNLYWGWGGEDNDLFWRIRAAGLPVVRNSKPIARYTSLDHSTQSPNPLRYSLLRNAAIRFKNEGISTLKYNVDSVIFYHLYTHIVVNLNPDKANVTKIPK